MMILSQKNKDKSAFKPYKVNNDTDQCISNASIDTKKLVSSGISSPSLSQKNYTIEKLLNNSSASDTTAEVNGNQQLTSTPSSSSASMIMGNVPKTQITSIDLLHALWMHQNHKINLSHLNLNYINFPNSCSNVPSPSSGVPSSPATIFSASSAAHLRRYLLPQSQQRQSRGPRRQRTTFTHEQTLRLEMEYHCSEYITRGKRFQLAELLDLSENQIKIWFQNRRAKDKRIEKAIVEQQYRYLSSAPYPQQLSIISNCSTCNYTQKQFGTSDDASHT